MAFLDTTTRVIKLSDRRGDPSVLIKNTVTVEDIVFVYARAAAVNKLGSPVTPEIPATALSQITRVPYVR